MRSIEILEIHVAATGCNLSCESCSVFCRQRASGARQPGGGGDLDERPGTGGCSPGSSDSWAASRGCTRTWRSTFGWRRKNWPSSQLRVQAIPATLPGQSLEVFDDCLPAIAEGGIPRAFVPLGPLPGLRGGLPRAARRPNSIGSSPARRKGSVPCARPHRRFSRSLHRWPRLIHRVADCGRVQGAGSRGSAIPSPRPRP